MREDGRWDLAWMYKSFDDPAFAADTARIPEAIREANELLKSGLNDTELLEALADRDAELSALFSRLGTYCALTLSANANDEAAAANLNRLDVLENDLQLLSSAEIRRIGAMTDLESSIAQSEKLREIAFALREAKEEARHLIPEAVEPWILKMKLSGGTAFSQLRDKLDSTHMVPYRGKELPLAAVRGMAYDADESVRRDAYDAEIGAYGRIAAPMAACLNSIKLEARTLAEARGYASVLDMTLQQSRMDAETLDAILGAIREALPDFRRYLKAKARVLGHKHGLPFYDLFAPVGGSRMRFTVSQARAKLLAEMGKFTPDMAAFIDNAFESDWIDMYPREGKTGGAFCAGVHEADRSLILTNFQGSFSDVSTLAHELGHAWHNRCMAGLPVQLTNTPMELAETASIFNETMLSWQVLQSADTEDAFALLESSLMEATQTVVDIYSRYLFESEVVDTCSDHAMTVEELKAAMLRAQDASYGDGLDPDFRHPFMWACKSHYYSSGFNFYNFPYAFGLLFGKGVFAKYLEEGDAFVPFYCKLLRSCGSGTVAEVAASAGIDVRSMDFWRASLNMIRKDIDRFCGLCAERVPE